MGSFSSRAAASIDAAAAVSVVVVIRRSLQEIVVVVDGWFGPVEGGVGADRDHVGGGVLC